MEHRDLVNGRVVVSCDQIRDDNRVYHRAKRRADEMGVNLEILDDRRYREAMGLEVEPIFVPKPGANILPDGTECWYVTREEARNPQRYQAAKAKASEMGLNLMIMPTDIDPGAA